MSCISVAKFPPNGRSSKFLGYSARYCDEWLGLRDKMHICDEWFGRFGDLQ